MRQGFTLIELLIVVTIIGILAAIAVQNLLLARVRANVARVEADQRSFKTAHESYRIDNDVYIQTDRLPFGLVHTPMESRWVPLTTPISYISTIPWDPFGDDIEVSHVVQTDGKWRYRTYDFVSGNEPLGQHSHDAFLMVLRGDLAPTHQALPREEIDRMRLERGWEHIPRNTLYYFASQGPDRLVGTRGDDAFVPVLYDPSNGTISPGDIFAFGP